MSLPARPAEAITWEETLFQNLYRMIQAVRIHQDNNQLVKVCVERFKETISKLQLESELKLWISEGRFFVQSERLHYRKELVRIVHAMLDFFNRRALQGVCFGPLITEAPMEEIVAFVRVLIQSVEKAAPASWLEKQMEVVKWPWLRILKGLEFERGSDKDLREKARNTYFHALTSVKDVVQRVSVQGHAGVRKAKRMVQNMVDCLSQDESLFLCLSTIKDYDDYTYSHSVNVAVLSLCLGNRIGFSRTSLEHLGICGLFHDLGKVEVPHEILNKPGHLTEEEWRQMQNHPMASVRQILRLHATHDLKSKIILAPFEHHIKYDLSGYPHVLFKNKVSLFGRILQIADVYDAITSPRAYRSSYLSPDQAVSFMLKGAGKDFDPVLLKVFAIMMGTYPVGTLLELDTGEMGIVADYPMESGGHLPRVVLLHKEGEGPYTRGETIDLSEKDPHTGSFRRNVVKSLNAASRGIQPASFLLQ
jgi:HD-GYP domain-containing protein (c-di-GMP phosphodiesterase class II)